MYDRYPDRLPEPPPPRRHPPISRVIASVLFTAFRISGTVLFLALGLAVIVPILVFLIRSIDPDRPPRVPIAERVGHTNGIAIDPGDGALYVTTPRGLFWIKNPEWAQRITDSYQDFQGLIALGPGEFLAGGRPDIRDRVSGFAAQYSGLIRSTDAGEKWRSISLSGKAHFSAIEARSGTVFAYDVLSKGFMLSENGGKTWETRSTLPELLDFAVDPAGSQRVFASTEDELLASADGGGSWRATSERHLVWLEWPDAGSFWGVDAGGAVFLSEDAGMTWMERGMLPGPVESFLAAPAALYAGVYDEATGTVLFKSVDAGQTWQEIYRDPPLASG